MNKIDSWVEVYGLPIRNSTISRLNFSKSHSVIITGDDLQVLYFALCSLPNNLVRGRDKLIRKITKGF